MVVGPDTDGFHTVVMPVGGEAHQVGTWEPIDIHEIETGEVEIEPLTLETAREEHLELLHLLRDAIVAAQSSAIREASFALSVLEHQFPELEPDTSRYTERDN